MSGIKLSIQIVIALLMALGLAYQFVRDGRDLVYEIVGPVEVHNMVTFSIEVSNESSNQVEQNVVIQVVYLAIEDFEDALSVQVDSMVPTLRSSTTERASFIELGNLRPGESATVRAAVMYTGSHDFRFQKISVKSEDRIGYRIEEGESLLSLLLVTLFSALIAVSVATLYSSRAVKTIAANQKRLLEGLKDIELDAEEIRRRILQAETAKRESSQQPGTQRESDRQ